jgi:hypothetical protein
MIIGALVALVVLLAGAILTMGLLWPSSAAGGAVDLLRDLEKGSLKATEKATYRVTAVFLWGQGSGGAETPATAHWSAPVAAFAKSPLGLVAVGERAGDGLKSLAETGATASFKADAYAAGGKTCVELPKTSAPFATVEKGGVEVAAGERHASLTSMMAPSPDWFVHADADLVDGDGHWRNVVVVSLSLFDAGTKADQGGAATPDGVVATKSVGGAREFGFVYFVREQ